MDGLRIGARELRRDLAAQLRRAAGGQHLVVTVDGRPTATLGPVMADHGDATLDALVASGALVSPRRLDAIRVAAPIAVWSGVRLDRAFAEVRG
jgi:antitoxin (DNA-binding transcriptional repressor) of toxin-antitoxin stability system